MQLDAVLPVLLANWVGWMNPILRTACALLQTNSACRQAVQHAAASGTAHISAKSYTKLAQFSAWLHNHAGLLTSIHISTWDKPKEPSLARPADSNSWTAHWPAAQHLLSTALQQSLDRSTASPISTAGMSHHGRIADFNSPCPTSPALLDALAGFSSLTRLSVSCSPGQPAPSVCDALGRLRSLESLHLEFAAGRRMTVVSPQLASALHQLQALTSLSLDPHILPDQLWSLPSGLQYLCAHVAAEEVPEVEQQEEEEEEEVEQQQEEEEEQEQEEEEEEEEEEQEWVPPVQIDLQQLTQLTRLILYTSAPVSEASVLPENLVQFYVRGPVDVHPSSNLQALDVSDPQKSLGLMRFLPNLPQLRKLKVCMSAYEDDDSVADVFAAIQQATQVRKLDWNIMHLGLDAEDNAALATELQLGSVLGGLTHLEKLHLQLDGIPESEVLQLTALTQLTELCLDYCFKGVTDVVVVALAVRLKELRVLSLRNCGLQSQAVLPALASLQSLSELTVDYINIGPPKSSGLVVTDEGLQLLTTLTCLTQLYISSRSVWTNEGRARFLAAMPQLVDHNLGRYGAWSVDG